VPQRDVLHIRLHSVERKRPFPLMGETPLIAALASITASSAITQQQINFFNNQARPSAVLSTDQILDKDQVQFLRDRWNEQAKGLDGCGPGGVPILTAGLKVLPWSTPGKDAQIAEVMKLSDENIALAFRIPLQVLGLGNNAYSTTELLFQAWLASGLGFALEHIEQAFDRLFQLDGQPYDYIEFDTSALLRSAYKDRIEGLVRAVQGGVMSPNEARNSEGFDNVKFGDEPRLQAQMVPLSAATTIPAVPAAAAAPAAPGEKPPAPTDEKPPAEKPEPPKDYDAYVQRLSRSLTAAANRHSRLRPNL
jgi:HK97 family phage portal protein